MTPGYMYIIYYHRGALIWPNGSIFRSKIVIFIRYEGKNLKNLNFPPYQKFACLALYMVQTAIKNLVSKCSNLIHIVLLSALRLRHRPLPVGPAYLIKMLEIGINLDA